MISRYVVADPSALQAHVDKIVGTPPVMQAPRPVPGTDVRTAELVEAPLTGGPASPPLTRRGTTNRNARGGSPERRRRREWLLQTYRADLDVLTIDLPDGPMVLHVERGDPMAVPACRCYRCGVLLTVETLTVDRIKPGCQGGTYRRENIRPACGKCNSETGGATRGGTKR